MLDVAQLQLGRLVGNCAGVVLGSVLTQDHNASAVVLLSIAVFLKVKSQDA